MLELRDVTVDFDGLRAVDRVTMTIPKGAIIGLIGPNGSGKSSLINAISGMIPASGGRILFDGEDITRMPADAIFHRGLARGFQDPSLFFQMSVLDNTLLPVKRQRGEKPWLAPWRRAWKRQEEAHAARAEGILRQINLRAHFGRSASDLSGGQMKLSEIGRCLMGDASLLLLDEPTAGVAPKLAHEIFELLAALRRDAGTTFLIVEHRLEILFNFVDQVCVMYMGQLIAQGTPDEIAANATVREVYFGD